MNPDLAARVLASPRLDQILRSIRLRSVASDFPNVRLDEDAVEVDWGFALMCASFVADVQVEFAQDAALRIAQGCLSDPTSDATAKATAELLLIRTGNNLSLELATSRGPIEGDEWLKAPPSVALDAVRSQLDLAIASPNGVRLRVNAFQRDFWSAASAADWISISAPTSVGKSFIVRTWIEERLKRSSVFRGLYVVPTRALIDEVAGELRPPLSSAARVVTLPWEPDVNTGASEIYVLTQERVHLLHDLFPSLAMDVIFIDEAQKLYDGGRGILLQRVLAEAVRRNPAAQVFFASPLSANPDALLVGIPDGLRAQPMTSESVTVAQNLFWVNSVPRHPRRWAVELVIGGSPEPVGELQLPASPSPESKRLPLVAVAMSGASDSNVVYVNGAAAAEKCAAQIYGALGDGADASDDESIEALRELSATVVHDRYALDTVLRRRVAFHYGKCRCSCETRSSGCFDRARCAIWSARRPSSKASTCRARTCSLAVLAGARAIQCQRRTSGTLRAEQAGGAKSFKAM